MNLVNITNAERTPRPFVKTVVGACLAMGLCAPVFAQAPGQTPTVNTHGSRDDTHNGTNRADDRNARKDGAGEARRLWTTMRGSGVNLADAIRTAERETNGQAVEARMRSAPNGTPAIDVIVTDSAGQFQCVLVDANTGKVLSKEQKDGAVIWTDHGMDRTNDPNRNWNNDPNNPNRDPNRTNDPNRNDPNRNWNNDPNNPNRDPNRPVNPNDRTRTDPNNRNVPTDRNVTTAPERDINRDLGRDNRDPNRDPNRDLSRDRADMGPVMKAEEVIGQKITNAAGESLGKIEDLAISSHDGRVAYAVVSYGGVLGMGDKLYAVPWNALTSHTRGKYIVDMDKKRLETAPSFDKNNWPDMSTSTFAEGVYPFYGRDPRNDGAIVRDTTSYTGPLMKASDFDGRDVKNTKNENLGEIEDLAIAPQSGRIKYAVLSYGGVLGMGDKLFAVPWSALTHRADGTCLLDVDKERLKTAEGFDKSNWPNMSDERWASRNDEIYRNRTGERRETATGAER